MDAWILGFLMSLFYSFQQVYRLPVIFECTLGARAAAKRQKPGDWQGYRCMKIEFQLLVHDTSAFAVRLDVPGRALVRYTE